jgi:hypothetical protein
VKEEAAERRENRFARLAPANRLEQLVLERLEAPVDEILLRREVVVDSLLRHLRRACDLGDRDSLEAALDEETERRLRDVLACALLLPLAKTAHCGYLTVPIMI